MLGKTNSYSRTGLNCRQIEVEVDVKNGLPAILITGMLSQEVKEARERIKPAIQNSGFTFPNARITVNLSPAESIKSGTHYDLSIAIALLQAQGYINDDISKFVFFGELNLSGHIKNVRGILPLVMNAIKDKYSKIFIPVENIDEISFIDNDSIIPVSSINDTIAKIIKPFTRMINGRGVGKGNDIEIPDFIDITGQEQLIDAFKIAAGGHHHMLIVGPPGCGKTMGASRLPGIMPSLKNNEIVQLNIIHSLANEKGGYKWLFTRPFRTPHNSFSRRALIGGGPRLLPGEVSLAHNGILFLDEFLEFSSDALQALRTVIEKKEAYISMRNGYSVYPADFLLIAAANPCPCGFYGTNGGCRCNVNEVKRYRRKLKNPLTDRIDLQIKVDRVKYMNLKNNESRTINNSTKEIYKSVLRAREIQRERYKNENFSLNSEIRAPLIDKYCKIDRVSESMMEEYIDNNYISARGVHKILKVARTIADLKEADMISQDDIETALAYRFLDVEEL